MADQRSSGGIGLCGTTFIVFLVLKLCGLIDWSWWWVTCPIWAPLALVLAALAVSGIAALVVKLL